jgi:hypothetical protein
MPRPKKNPEDRKAYHLRVPLTEAQRAVIVEASGLADKDIAAWAREILLDAAKRAAERARKAGDKPA